MEYRKQQHYREAKSKNRKSVYFHNALNKYGYDNFIFEKIDEAQTLEELNEKERFWIKFYDSTNKNLGYNLDSGGNSGGKKSEETKRKIGETTKKKWENQEIAKKMKEGLLKGTETMKRNAKSYPFICPICGKTYYYQKNIAEKKKFCSINCANKSGCWKKGVNNSAIISHKRNLKRKYIIKNDVEKWALKNKDVVLNCPYNKITGILCDLRRMLKEVYDIKDLRTIFVCFNVKNLRELLDKLKEIIYISKENVC